MILWLIAGWLVFCGGFLAGGAYVAWRTQDWARARLTELSIFEGDDAKARRVMEIRLGRLAGGE